MCPVVEGLSTYLQQKSTSMCKKTLLPDILQEQTQSVDHHDNEWRGYSPQTSNESMKAVHSPVKWPSKRRTEQIYEAGFPKGKETCLVDGHSILALEFVTHAQSAKHPPSVYSTVCFPTTQSHITYILLCQPLPLLPLSFLSFPS